MKKSRMFSFITKTCNPLGGRCPHGCVYCYSMSEQGLVNQFNMQKYVGPPVIWESEIKKRFHVKEFVFPCDMVDLFADLVPEAFLVRFIDEFLLPNFDVNMLLMTKNPKRYLKFIELVNERIRPFPSWYHLGATIETNCMITELSNAPGTAERLYWMQQIKKRFPDIKLFISVEPIMDFMTMRFIEDIKKIKPWAVAAGYDNHYFKLREPAKSKTLNLIYELSKFTRVYVKTIRDPVPRDNQAIIQDLVIK